jgi:hypothetical protein
MFLSFYRLEILLIWVMVGVKITSMIFMTFWGFQCQHQWARVAPYVFETQDSVDFQHTSLPIATVGTVTIRCLSLLTTQMSRCMIYLLEKGKYIPLNTQDWAHVINLFHSNKLRSFCPPGIFQWGSAAIGFFAQMLKKQIFRHLLSINTFCLLFCSGDIMASAQKKVSPKPKSRQLTSQKSQID